ncbi:MAG: hypothetical protein HC811_00545 [Flammeovirgaceae bacterium]|nr:hypothetical protein [Flammeovirgaceae bacterium]
MKYSFFIIVLALSISTPLAAQKDYSSDVSSVDNIMKALYEVISGEAAEARDWDRFRFLFKPDAKLIPTYKNAEGVFNYRYWSPEEYVNFFTSSRREVGFYEIELHRVTETYGTITHAFSTYETSEKKGGPATNRGINSIQIFYDTNRYYIMNIFWCGENNGFALPDMYLKK